MRSKLLIAVGVMSMGSVALSIVLQNQFDMQPCAWCTLQRLVYLLIGAAAWLAWLVPGIGSVVLAWAGTALAAAGECAAAWQQFVASRSASCDLTLADRIVKGLGLDELLPQVFKATAFCNEANMPLAGVPFAVWSMALYAALFVLLIAAASRRNRRARA
jgi:disulfide bond formation protein DsbB